MSISKKITILVAIVAIALVGYFLVKFKGNAVDMQKNENKDQSGKMTKDYSKELFNLERGLDGTTSASIVLDIESQVRKIAKNNLSPDEDAQAKLLLARILNYRVSGSDSPIAGMNLLKEVAKNEKYPNLWRSLAFQGISDTIKDVADDEYLKIILEDDYFKSMRNEAYPQGGTIKNLCQASYDLYPLPLCSYRIANFDLFRLLDDRMIHNLNDQQRADYMKDAKEKIDVAEKLMSNYPLEYMNLFDKGKSEFWKPFIRTKLYLLGEIKDKNFMVEGAKNFEDGVEIFSNGKIWPKPQGFLTYFYATSVAEVYREEKIDKIRELTDDLVERYKQFPKIPFFIYTRKLSDTKYNNTYDAMQFILLSQLNPNFKNLLLELGWSEERLNTPFPKLP